MSSQDQIVESVKRILNINESSLSKIWRKYQECDSGTISACRDENTPAQNSARTAKLKAALMGMGYSVTKINGVYIENYGTSKAKKVREVSFIVFDQNQTGALEQALRHLGAIYNQDSITYNSVKENAYYLIGTSRRPSSYPGYGKKVRLGKPMFGQSGEFHSTVNGRPFVFNECTSVNTHDYDDTLRKYHSWHGQVFKHIANQFLAINENEIDRIDSSMLED
jgi:hypothetical protein